MTRILIAWIKTMLIILCCNVRVLAHTTVKEKEDLTVITGTIRCEGSEVPFASVMVDGTTIGVASNADGAYELMNLPTGRIAVRVQAIGYAPEVRIVEVTLGQSIDLDFTLHEDNIGLETVVVTADRNAKNRQESSTIVNAIAPQLFERTAAVTLSEGLSFTPGLRLENDCQNCGFTQVRMNGMEGPYSQILINSRPIFSGLAGVYGLELIPANMIERVEVVRGGGSALYGSNAIAGTINLITKDPIRDAFQASVNQTIIGVGADGEATSDFNANFNTSLVSSDFKSGLSVFGFHRKRDAYDANNDDFSEISELENNTIGLSAYRRTGKLSKFRLDYFHIEEQRRGGNDFDKLEHEADIAESVDHSINTGALTWDQFLGEQNKLALYASAQHIHRDSYYGSNQDPSAYGETTDFAYSAGAQYFHNFGFAFFAPAQLIVGFEHNGDYLEDEKLPYFDPFTAQHVARMTISDQISMSTGGYIQNEWSLESVSIGVGLRFDHYRIEDDATSAEKVDGSVLSPRINTMIDLTRNLQLRASFAKGYRAPQIYDEDLHIETSGARKVIHENDPNLKQEDSKSVSLSLNWMPKVSERQVEFLVEGFYTKLDNPFTNIYGSPDAEGMVVFTRTNATKGAYVAGVNLELNASVSDNFQLQSGFTAQQSRFKEAQEFEEKRFQRTPDCYGYITFDWDLNDRICLASSNNFTGKMLVPYFGSNQEDPETGKLITSKPFWDSGLKLSYELPFKNRVNMNLSCGMKNIFNSYQNDFDEGWDRDPGFIYGPMLPRTIYFGVKIGNIL